MGGWERSRRKRYAICGGSRFIIGIFRNSDNGIFRSSDNGFFAETIFFRRLLKVLFMKSGVFGRGIIAVKFDSFIDYFGDLFAVFVGQKQFFVFLVG